MEANGGLASNYSIKHRSDTTANVTAKALTVSGITASNKVYDSTTTARQLYHFQDLLDQKQ